MTNIRVNRRPYNVEEYAVHIVDVNMDGCPVATPSSRPCQSSLIQVIYEGHGNLTFDFDLLPFTG